MNGDNDNFIEDAAVLIHNFLTKSKIHTNKTSALLMDIVYSVYSNSKLRKAEEKAYQSLLESIPVEDMPRA